LKGARFGIALLLLLTVVTVATLYGIVSWGIVLPTTQPKQGDLDQPTHDEPDETSPADETTPVESTEGTISNKPGEQPTGVPPLPSSSGSGLPLPVDRQLDVLRGRLRFNTPEQMQMGEPTRIVLALARIGTAQEQTPEEVAAAVRKRGGTKGEIAGAENVRATERMRARLTGKDFEIEARDSEIQPLTSEGVTSWKWDVTPTEWGKKTLHLSVEAFVIIHDRDTPITLRSYDRDITVTATRKQRYVTYVSRIPLGIRDAIILAILAAAWGLWRGWWSRIWARIRRMWERMRRTPPGGNPPAEGGGP